MKIKFFISCLLVLTPLLSFAQAGKGPYGIKVAKISYTIKGFDQNGSMEIIFDNWGSKQKVISAISMNELPEGQSDEKNVRRQMTVLTPAHYLNINLNHQEGHRLKGKEAPAVGLANEDNFVREESFLNKPCKVYLENNTSVWVWQGIVLKKIVMDPHNSEVILEEEATAIDLTYNPHPKEFDAPDNIRFN